MKSILAVLSALVLSVIFWLVAAFGLKLLTYTYPDSWFGETADTIIETAMIWLLSPGIGTYYGLKVTQKYFPEVEVKTLFISITAVIVTYAVIMEVISITMYLGNNPYSPGILGMIVLIAQSASFIAGAYIYKSDEGS